MNSSPGRDTDTYAEAEAVTVTVAIPTRNRAGYLRQALGSVLRSKYRQIEVIVSDNASTDQTPELADEFRRQRVIWLRQETDLGMVGNWNACLREATGAYFVLLSDDDELLPDAIGRLVAAATSPETPIAVVYGAVDVIDASGALLTRGHVAPAVEERDAFLNGWLRSRRSIYPCATLLRRTQLQQNGGYLHRYGPFADVAAWLAMLRSSPHGSVAFVPETVALYRTHATNLSAQENIAADLEKFDAMVRDFESFFGVRHADPLGRYRAAILAGKLRMIAKTAGTPALEYLRQLKKHWRLATRTGFWEPFVRNWLILASPRAYEVYKRSRTLDQRA